MVFSSYEFIFLFLPVTLCVFCVLDRHRLSTPTLVWLLAASLFFYGWWNPWYLPLLLSSVAFNYALAKALRRRSTGNARSRWLLALGVGANLALLGTFKYANFAVDTAATLVGSDFSLAPITLPLAISFFTFQQIAYLVDAHRGDTAEYRPLPYAVFVTFFPQLIAGPIVRHDETIPQIERSQIQIDRSRDFCLGATIFTIGLFKKVILADGVSAFANPVFDAAHGGADLTLIEAWGGVLAYSFQIYFDFSGYTDMAIGGARLFGIKLPLNFDSPYRATSIIDFWKRWHMTLSRFLRDYLYIPLGGNRRGSLRRYENLMVTMLLGGLWHGAGWTFVLWGGLHGAYLLVNHAWRAFRPPAEKTIESRGLRWGPRLLTFLAVVVAWVLFRAGDLGTAARIYGGMAGLNGVTVPPALLPGGAFLADILGSLGIQVAATPHFAGATPLGCLAALFVLASVGPNTQQLLSGFDPALPVDAPNGGSNVPWPRWSPTAAWAALMALLALAGILNLERADEFLYFQF